MMDMETPLFKEQDLSRVSLLLAIIVVGVLVLRFLIVVVIAGKFGTSEIADVLFIAQLIPINVFLQNRKAIMMGFVPVYTEYMVQGDEQKLWQFTNQFTSLLVCFGIVVSLLYFIGAPYLMRPLTVGFTAAQRELTIDFTRLLAPAMLFFVVFSVEESLLYSHKHFTTSNWAMLLGGIGGLLGLLFLTDRYGLFGYGYGALAGYFVQVIIPLSLFWKYRRNFSISLNFKDPGLVRVYKLMYPVYAMGSLLVLVHITSRALAATLGPGCVSAFQYSGTLTWVLPIVLANSILVPLFPIISEKVARNEMESLKEILRQGTSMLIFSVTPIVVSILLLRVPLIQFVFERGEFTPEDTRLTAYTLAFFAPLILAMVLSLLYMQAIVTLRLVHIGAKLTVMLIPLNFLLAITLMKVFDVGGIALAMTLTFFIQTGVAVLLIRRSIGPIGIGRLMVPSLKVLIGCALSAVPAYCLFQHIEAFFDMSRLSLRFVGLALEASIFFVLYGLFFLVFGRDELRTFQQLTKTRRDKKGSEMTMPMPGGG